MSVVGGGSDKPPKISNTKIYSGYRKVKGLNKFKLKRGNKPTNVYSTCREVVSLTRKRTTA